MKLFFGLMDKINPSGSLSFSRETSSSVANLGVRWTENEGTILCAFREREDDTTTTKRRSGADAREKKKIQKKMKKSKRKKGSSSSLCVFGGIERRHFLPSFFLFTKQHFYYTQHKLTDKNTLTPILLKPEQQNHTQEEE